jgi:hypothetical protein
MTGVIVPSPAHLASSSSPLRSTHATLIANLVHLAQRGALTLYPQQGHNVLVALPDAYEAEDWFVVGACGHVSTGHVSRSEAEQWRCPACDEQRLSERNIADLTARLRFAALHVQQSVASSGVNATQSRFHGDVA